MPEVEIGMGRTARSAYELDDVSIVPSRRTRSSSDISTSWQIDAYRFDIPLLTQPTDAIVSPAVAAAVSGLGGLGVLDGEGLWARYPDPQRVIDELIAQGEAADDPDEMIAALQKVYCDTGVAGSAHRGDPDPAGRRRHGGDPAVPAERLHAGRAGDRGRDRAADHPGHHRLRRARAVQRRRR